VTGQGSWTSIIVDGALLALPMVGKLASMARTTTLIKEADDGTQVVIKTENMFIRTKVSISAGDEEFSQILPKGTDVKIGDGTLSSGSTRAR
jgi:hypothetical protein